MTRWSIISNKSNHVLPDIKVPEDIKGYALNILNEAKLQDIWHCASVLICCVNNNYVSLNRPEEFTNMRGFISALHEFVVGEPNELFPPMQLTGDGTPLSQAGEANSDAPANATQTATAVPGERIPTKEALDDLTE